MFDKDGDGKISSEEVFHTLNSIGMKVDLKAAKKMVRQVDLDGELMNNKSHLDLNNHTVGTGECIREII